MILRLLVSCPDRPGIVAAVSGFLFERGANIVDAEQHTSGDRFFLRVEATPAEGDELERLRADFEAVADRFGMDWRLAREDPGKRVGILVSREDHCLLDLLWRFEQGELEGTPAVVISNHPDAAPHALHFGVPFHHVPTPKDAKPQAEAELLSHLEGSVDVVVLARYMQILSERFLDELRVPAINIHHSFLPAFVGAEPYRRAHERGVKLIGATAHYATADLDDGPIIEQDVLRVTHRQTPEELQRAGQDVERTVLARAVQWHLEDRVLVHGDRTIVFA